MDRDPKFSVPPSEYRLFVDFSLPFQGHVFQDLPPGFHFFPVDLQQPLFQHSACGLFVGRSSELVGIPVGKGIRPVIFLQGELMVCELPVHPFMNTDGAGHAVVFQYMQLPLTDAQQGMLGSGQFQFQRPGIDGEQADVYSIAAFSHPAVLMQLADHVNPEVIQDLCLPDDVALVHEFIRVGHTQYAHEGVRHPVPGAIGHGNDQPVVYSRKPAGNRR